MRAKIQNLIMRKVTLETEGENAPFGIFLFGGDGVDETEFVTSHHCLVWRFGHRYPFATAQALRLGLVTRDSRVGCEGLVEIFKRSLLSSG